MDASKLIFVHNMKTAGATLRHIIARQYERGSVHTIIGKHWNLRKIDVGAGLEAENVRVIQGHIPFGLHAALKSDCTYITVLREPIDRVVSLYYYTLGKPGHTLLVDGRTMTREAFVRGGASTETDHAQTRRVSGLDAEFGGCTREMLDRAKGNLRERMAVVGLTERFDETLVLLRRAFGWKYLLYSNYHVNRARSTLDSLTSEVREVITRHNALDIELYQYAGELFEEAVRQQGIDFERELRAFRQVSEEYVRDRAGTPVDGAPSPIGSPPERSVEEYAAELRVSIVEEHRALAAREVEFRKEVRRREAFQARLDIELERSHQRQARLDQQLERLRARDATRTAEMAGLKERIGVLERTNAALREKLDRTHERARQARSGRASRLGAPLRKARAWVRARTVRHP